MKRVPIHVLLMGESGVGKDTFAATFPKPMLVWHLDGYGQEMPYMKGALEIGELQEYRLGNSNLNITYRDIQRPDGLVRVEYFSSDDPQAPNVSVALSSRISFLRQEQGWQTLCCGSLSSAALEGRLYEQFVLNPQFKDPRKWYGAATEYVERLIASQKSLPYNVVFMCHVGQSRDEMDGSLVYTPDLPGRLSYGAARYFNEMYRVHVVQGEDGKRFRSVQTDHDGRYQAKTHIDAPNPCYPSYESLWVNWDKTEGVEVGGKMLRI